MRGQRRGNIGSRFTKYGSIAAILSGLLIAACLIMISGGSTGAQIVIKPLKITTASLPDGAVGTDYNTPLSATGGKQPYIWSVVSGVLPNGLSLSAAGVISGTPAYKQYESFTIKVQDAAGASATRVFGINVILVPKLRSFYPAPFSNNAARTTSIDATFNEPIRTPSPVTFSVHGSMSGRMPGTYFGGWTQSLSFQPNSLLWPGEEVEVSLTRGLISNDSIPLGTPVVTRFRVATAPSGASYFGELFQFGDYNDRGSAYSSVQVFDLNGDGIMDIVNADWEYGITFHIYSVVYQRYETSLLININSERYRGWSSISFGDMDGDGDLDLVAEGNNWTTEIWLNDGQGVFSFRNTLADWYGQAILGDVDGDGDLDIFDGYSTMYFNGGNGVFGEPGRQIGSDSDGPGVPRLAQFGDMDGDGDLDLVCSMEGYFQYRIYTNDGAGSFSLAREFVALETGPDSIVPRIEVGDYDNDGDLDFAGVDPRGRQASRVYFNDGQMNFLQSVTFGYGSTESPQAIRSGDMDGDGDLDLVVGCSGQNRVYINGGFGNFDSDRAFGTAFEPDKFGSPTRVMTSSIALADMNGDGDLDIVAHHFNPGILNAGQRNRVYENR